MPPDSMPTRNRYPAGRRAFAGLLLLIVCLLGSVEWAARYFVRRLSRIEGRVGAEAAALVRPTGTRPVVWFLGNSLLDAAVDFPVLREAVQDRVEARRFIVEQTFFHDWHYGLRRLLAAGTPPRSIVLMLNEQQLIADGSRGDYAAFTLVATGDIFPFVRDLEVHPTNASNLIFANGSMFYGLRSDIRKFALGKLLPDLPRLTSQLVPASGPPMPPLATRQALSRERVRVLREECARHSVRLIFAIPPSSDYRLLPAFQESLTSEGLAVLAPFGPDDFPARYFSDGFHLNAEGARHYTRQLTQALLAADLLPDR